MGRVANWWLYFFFFGMYYIARRHAILDKVVRYTALGANIAALYSLYQFFVRGQRAEAFYSHSLTLGNTQAMVLCLLVGGLVTRSFTGRGELSYYLFSIVLVGLSLFLSLSRGPLLAVILTLPIIFTVAYRWKGFAISSLCIILVVSAMFSTPAFRSRMEKEDLSDHRTSFGVRVALWKISLKIITEHPLFGIGERNFRKEARKHTDTDFHTMAHAHNAYLHFALTHGIPAFLVLFALILKLLYDTLKSSLARRREGIIGCGVLVVFLLESMTENTIGDSEVVMLFFFLMGLLTAEMAATHTDDPHPETKASLSGKTQ
jgi:O-antigen ligase